MGESNEAIAVGKEREKELAAVRRELEGHKEEVHELWRMLLAVEVRNEATAAAMEKGEREWAAVKSELAAVKGELAALKGELAAVKGQSAEVKGELTAVKGELVAVKGELTMVKGELAVVKGGLVERKVTMAEQWVESSRASAVEGLRGKSLKRRRVVTVEKDLELNIEQEIRQSTGDQKKALERIKAESRRTDLNLANLSGLSDAILGHVSTKTHLKSVLLYKSSGFSAEGIKHLYRLPQLKILNFNDTDVSDSALEGIGTLTSLKELCLYRTKLTNAGLLQLTTLSSLKDLGLTGCMGVTDAGMVHVGRLTGLTKLDLGGTAVTDDGLQELNGLTKLKLFQLPNGTVHLRACISRKGRE